MEKDRFGNLLFSNGVRGDRERMELIYDVLRQASGRHIEPGQAGKNQTAANSRAKAMIDAGELPDSDDLQGAEAMPLEERVGRFIRQGHRIPVAVVREDEVEDLVQNLRTQPLDYEGFEFGPGRGERSREADRLAGQIVTLPEPENS